MYDCMYVWHYVWLYVWHYVWLYAWQYDRNGDGMHDGKQGDAHVNVTSHMLMHYANIALYYRTVSLET